MSTSTPNNPHNHLTTILLNKVIIVAALFSATTLILTSCTDTLRQPPERIIIPEDSIASGDLAFRMGRSIESELIASSEPKNNKKRANPDNIKQTRYSHAGICIRSDSGIVVIHIEPQRDAEERVQCEYISDFFSREKASAGAVMRFKSLTEPQKEAIKKYASTVVRSDILFDHNYSLSDSSAMYCTELVEQAFLKADISLAQERRHKLPLVAEPVILPSDIIRHDSLTVLDQVEF